MVNSKDYRVVVVEPLFSPSSFRNTLARAFFNHFAVRYVITSVLGLLLSAQYSVFPLCNV